MRDGFAGIQTHKVEQQVAGISGSYTNALQLKARYDVLKERQELKYAALDCWKIVAEQLPPSITLQRFSFARRQEAFPEWHGDAGSGQHAFRFQHRHAKSQGQRIGQCSMPRAAIPVNPRQTGNNTVTWSFSLELQKTEAAP